MSTDTHDRVAEVEIRAVTISGEAVAYDSLVSDTHTARLDLEDALAACRIELLEDLLGRGLI